MQYILSEEEYKGLLNQIAKVKSEKNTIINELCQMVADHVPIDTWPGTKENPKPWMCYKSRDFEWYCDNCPVQAVCAGTKHWSK